MAEQTRDTRRLVQMLLTGGATAGVSAALFVALPTSGESHKRTASGVPNVHPARLPDSVAEARPLSVDDPLILQTAGRRRARRQQIADDAARDAAAQLPAPPQVPTPQAAHGQQSPANGAAQPQPLATPAHLSPVERELQRLYAENGIEMPQLPSQGQSGAPAGPALRTQMPQQAGPPATAAQPAPVAPAPQVQTNAIPAPTSPPAVAPTPSPTPSADRPLKPVPERIVDIRPDAGSTDAEAPPRKKGLLERFGLRKDDAGSVPPQEPRPYVPPATLAESQQMADAQPLNEAPPPPVTDDVFGQAAIAEADASTPAAIDAEAVQDELAADSEPPLHPLAERNYARELFGAEPAPEPVHTPAAVTPDLQAFIPAAPEADLAENFDEELLDEFDESDAMFAFEGEDAEEELIFEKKPHPLAQLDEEPAPRTRSQGSPAAVPEPVAEALEESEPEEPFNPFTGLRLEERNWDDAPSMPPLPPPDLHSRDPFEGVELPRPTRDEDWSETEEHDPVPLPSARTPGLTVSHSTPSRRTLVDISREHAVSGYCPVQLRDQRQLTKGQTRFASEFDGQVYLLSSADARQRFEASPQRYAPAAQGQDIVIRRDEGANVPGSLEFSVWYQGRLFAFSSAETLQTFIGAPRAYSRGE
ncbi:MAG: hypothetical protein KF774_06575 [Planctomyces sp.]|nr:hypothetical protein [Planctomyces sp.]